MHYSRHGAHGESVGYQAQLCICVKGTDVMTTNDEKIALMLQLIWNGCGGSINSPLLEKSLPDEAFTKDTERLLTLFPHLAPAQATTLAVIASMFGNADKVTRKQGNNTPIAGTKMTTVVAASNPLLRLRRPLLAGSPPTLRARPLFCQGSSTGWTD